MSAEIPKRRIAAIDAARGCALLGMFSVHIIASFDDNFSPNAPWMIAAGRSAALFAVCAGVAMVLATRRVDWTDTLERRKARLSIAVRAAVIALVGSLLAYFNNDANLSVYIILPYYALAFLVAFPFLRRSSKTIAIGMVCSLVFGPFLALIGVVIQRSIADPATWMAVNYTTTDIVQNPIGFLSQVSLTGAYPVVCYLSYVLAGMLIARWSLRSNDHLKKTAAAGLLLAVVSYAIGWTVLHATGAYDGLLARRFSGGQSPAAERNIIDWVGNFQILDPASLLRSAPHANTLFEMSHNIGVAMTIIGVLGLILRSSSIRRGLMPLLAAGSMPLTLYVAHVLTISSDALSRHAGLLMTSTVLVALTFALVWRRLIGQGPLERLLKIVVSAATSRIYRHRASEPNID